MLVSRGRWSPCTGAISLSGRGLAHVAVAVENLRDRLFPEIPAELQAPVREDGRVDDGDPRAVGGGAGGHRDPVPDADALRARRGGPPLDEARFGLPERPRFPLL